jgi:hypothetical protein
MEQKPVSSNSDDAQDNEQCRRRKDPGKQTEQNPYIAQGSIRRKSWSHYVGH